MLVRILRQWLKSVVTLVMFSRIISSQN